MNIYIQLISRIIVIVCAVGFIMNSKIHLSIKLISSIFIIINLINRNFYLPFLEKCVIPIGNTKNTENNIPIIIKDLPKNTTVIAWSANKSNTLHSNPYIAYGDYTNYDIVKSNENGEATVMLSCPTEYFVRSNKKIPKHIHYRYELPEYKALFSEVKTQFIEQECL
jgi:hypothetical protein